MDELEELTSYLWWVLAWKRDIERTKKLMVPYANYRHLLGIILEGEDDKGVLSDLSRGDLSFGSADSG